MLAILETNDHDHYYTEVDEEVIGNTASDIEKTELVTEIDEEDDVLQVNDTDSEYKPINL